MGVKICLNGHIAESVVVGLTGDFCARCGAATITACPKCATEISEWRPDGFGWLTQMDKAPNFCTGCGSPFPWTESALKAAHDLANEIKQISDEERDILNQNLDEPVKDTPQTEVAAMRVKKILHKAGTEAVDALRKIIIDIASETAKKLIFGQ
jgi:hypothetical protein